MAERTTVNTTEDLEQHLQPAEVEARLRELGALRSGHVQLQNGHHADTVSETNRVLQFPGLAKELGRLLGEQFNELEIDLVLSPGISGGILAHEVARALGRRHLHTVHDPSGSVVLPAGLEIHKGENAVIVDRMLTRGTSYRQLADLVRACEASVVGMGVIVDGRGEGAEFEVPVASLVQTEIQVYTAERCPLCAEGRPMDGVPSRHAP